jgi:hypothetical protein
MRRVKTHHGGIFRARKCICFLVHFVLFWAFFFISFSILKNTKNGFLTQIFPHNSCYISNDSVSSKNNYVFTHLCLFEWKTSSKCFLWNHMSGILHIELKWDNELIYDIWWLSTSSSLVIIWMVFEIHLHFVVYWYDYKFFINILFNHLISISKWDFFYNLILWVWITLFQVLFVKNHFNINLV